MPPKVSINLCCYNSEKFLQETLKSIEEQTFTDWELVVINDGSSDSTESIIMEFKSRGFPVLYHYQENRGLGYSRNRAIELSSGEYIAFIDHDDMWLPEKTVKQVDVVKSCQDVDLVYSNLFVTKKGRQTLFHKKRQSSGYVFDKFLRYYPVSISTVMIRKRSLDRLGVFFDSNLILTEEFDLFMRVLYGSKAAYIDQPLAVYRIHPGMSSIKYIEKFPDEMAYTIGKFKEMDPSFEVKYSSELDYLNAKIGYYRARAEMLYNNTQKARACLYPFRLTDYRFFLLYVITFFPPKVWHKIHSFMTKGAFSESG
ncbi:MAG: glycosyltransferase [Proteobacteria bacterium]|nr:glycosyltransferase [Pseudomonadota bacterium]